MATNWLGFVILVSILLLTVFFLKGWKQRLGTLGVWKQGQEDPKLTNEAYQNSAIDAPEKKPGSKRIIWIMHSWVPNVRAGSEITAEAQIEHLKKQGWDIIVLVIRWVVPEYKGVKIYPIQKGRLLESPGVVKLIQSADLVCVQNFNVAECLFALEPFNKPIVVFLHTQNDNRDILNFRIGCPVYIVYNVNFLKLEASNVHPSIVVHPKVDTTPFRIEKEDPIYVTLINCNENKGGALLPKLARALPEVQFLGIKGGYRKQITDTTLPNLRYIEHTTQIKDVYAQTWVLIMPSKEETWGRSAVEAMCSGIPVVVSPTPGLKECCGDAALYCDRDDLRSWVKTIRKLKEDKEFYNQRSALALQRARALDPTEELNQLEQWIQHDVLKSAVHTDRDCSSWEQSMLFR
jgi:glycosyltransferase involved in cell wall biosynthesis